MGPCGYRPYLVAGQHRCLLIKHLDVRPTSAHVHATRATGLEAREDGGDGETGETEPEECGGGLSLVAALGGVGRAIGDEVGLGVALSAY